MVVVLARLFDYSIRDLTFSWVWRSEFLYQEPQKWFIVGMSKIVGAHHEENSS